MGKANLPTAPEEPFTDRSGTRISLFPGFLRQNFLIFLFGFLGMVFLLGGIISLLAGSGSKKAEIVFEEGVLSSGKIKVDIEGAVVQPGVYELAKDARLQEALIFAGGLSSQADREWVAKNLNLAAKLTDGGKIYIPQVREGTGITSQASPRGSARGELGIKGEMVESKININTATAEELEKLPGVGPVTAQKIMGGRPYQTLEELLSKKIVGKSIFLKIKEQVTVW